MTVRTLDIPATFMPILQGGEKIIASNCLTLKAENGMTILFEETDIPYVLPVWPEELKKQQK